MKFYIKAFLFTTLISIVAYFIHTSVVNEPAISLFKTYVFLGSATFITVAILKFVTRVSANNLGVVFMGLVMMKFGGIIICFPELIDDDLQLSTRDLLGFLTPYFIFLFAEIIIVLKWLNDN